MLQQWLSPLHVPDDGEPVEGGWTKPSIYFVHALPTLTQRTAYTDTASVPQLR